MTTTWQRKSLKLDSRRSLGTAKSAVSHPGPKNQMSSLSRQPRSSQQTVTSATPSGATTRGAASRRRGNGATASFLSRVAPAHEERETNPVAARKTSSGTRGAARRRGNGAAASSLSGVAPTHEEREFDLAAASCSQASTTRRPLATKKGRGASSRVSARGTSSPKRGRGALAGSSSRASAARASPPTRKKGRPAATSSRAPSAEPASAARRGSFSRSSVPRDTRSRSGSVLEIPFWSEEAVEEEEGQIQPLNHLTAGRNGATNRENSLVDLTSDTPPPNPGAGTSRFNVVIDLTSSTPVCLPEKRKQGATLANEKATQSPGPSSVVSPVNEKEFSCPICLDSKNRIQRTDRKLASTMCGHVFCNKCLMDAWEAQKKCPICRVKVMKSEIHILHNI